MGNSSNNKNLRGHTDLNHGPIGLQPIALPLSYIPTSCLCLVLCFLSVMLYSPGHLTGQLHHFHECVGGIMVSIAAFQAVDPGSIPGRRMFIFAFYHAVKNKNAHVCRDQDSNLGYCGHNAGS